MGLLFCVLGRSGVGKDTLVNELCKQTELKKVVSRTTREPRYMEQDGINYFFSVVEDFVRDYEQKKVCAYTFINNNYYWTNISDIIDNDIYIIDPNGLAELRKNLAGTDIHIVSIYISAPAEETKRRGYNRSVNDFPKFLEESASESLQFDIYEAERKYDYCIHNTCFAAAIEQLKTIVRYEVDNYVF